MSCGIRKELIEAIVRFQLRQDAERDEHAQLTIISVALKPATILTTSVEPTSIGLFTYGIDSGLDTCAPRARQPILENYCIQDSRERFSV